MLSCVLYWGPERCGGKLVLFRVLFHHDFLKRLIPLSPCPLLTLSVLLLNLNHHFFTFDDAFLEFNTFP